MSLCSAFGSWAGRKLYYEPRLTLTSGLRILTVAAPTRRQSRHVPCSDGERQLISAYTPDPAGGDDRLYSEQTGYRDSGSAAWRERRDVRSVYRSRFVVLHGRLGARRLPLRRKGHAEFPLHNVA